MYTIKCYPKKPRVEAEIAHLNYKEVIVNPVDVIKQITIPVVGWQPATGFIRESLSFPISRAE